jgi:hypothetical protein
VLQGFGNPDMEDFAKKIIFGAGAKPGEILTYKHFPGE